MSNYNGLEIAIIGMSGRFPGADNVNAFWENLKAGVESIKALRDDELLAEGESQHVINDSKYVKASSFIDNKEYFDSAFFGFRPEEAQIMDPQIRIFLETCWSALEDAGINPVQNEDKIGLFAGGHANINWENYAILANRNNLVDGYSASQLRQINYLCSRVSYLLNLKGPSVYLNTACSTSLVAVQRASMSLLLNECKMALAGGVRINNYSKRGYLHEEGMINSKDGHCRAFDADSSGTVGGEGVGVVLLKKLKDALADGDTIHAIIRGSGVNNDGADKMSFTAPSVNGQYMAITKAINMARVEPSSISYVESHGTGTSLGDPIEVEALNLAFGKSETPYCALGAVKTNIGHLDAAAGITGLIKTVLALKHKQLPPTLHFKKPNPKINFKNSPFYVNAQLQDWERNGLPRRAGVSSFGIGGTNAHVVLEEAPEQKESTQSLKSQLLVVSGKTRSALKGNIDNLKNWLTQNKEVNLADVAYTLQTGRVPFMYRKTLVASNGTDAIEQLSAEKFGDGLAARRVKTKPSVVFMFSGQGSQYIDMCRDLYETETFFKAEIDRCFNLVQQIAEKDLKPTVFPENEAERSDLIHDTEFTQPLLFIIEYALAQLLMHWGIKPDKMIGHSIGEYVAACISGVFSLEDALALVLKRGELMQQADKGDMLSVSISEEALKPLLIRHKDVSLAVVNSSELCAVAGETSAIDRFRQALEKEGIKSKPIQTSHAFHSYMMDGILDEFRLAVSQMKAGGIKIPFISNLSKEQVSLEEVSQPQYWVDHLRHTVNFSQGIATLMEEKDVVFVEVGPGKSLSTFVRSHQLREKSHQVINMVRSPKEEQDDLSHLLAGLGTIWEYGIEPNWSGIYEKETRKKLSLPTYAFDKTRYPVLADAYKMITDLMSDGMVSKRADLSSWFYQPSWKIAPLPDCKQGRDEKCTLIFADDSGIGSDLSEKYRSQQEQVVIVLAGDAFEEQAPDSYRINPLLATDYDNLFARLAQHGLLPDRIVHAWGIHGQPAVRFSEEACQSSFYSLLEIIRACKTETSVLGKQFVLLTDELHALPGQKSQGSVVQSMASAFLKVFAQEYPTVVSSHIDLSLAEKADRGLIDALYHEIRHEETGKVVALRNSWRYVQFFDQLKVPELTEENQGFKQEGTYLITGGLGSLGLNLSRHLSGTLNARLILTGRTELPTEKDWEAVLQDPAADESIKQKIGALKELQAIGGQVLYQACDVANAKALTDVVKAGEAKFGKLNGVVHAAGASQNAATPISELDQAAFDRQFASKVHGLEALKEVMDGESLDFCIIASSISTVLGGLGFGAYAPANAFMDHYVNYWKRQGALENWISVDLDALSFDDQASESINGQEQLEVFERAISVRHLSQVIVSVSDLDKRLEKWINPQEVQEDDTVDAPLDGIDPENISASATEQGMIRLWQAFFGKSDLEPDDDFFEIGGDSLKALTMIGRIHKAFNVEVSVKEFFEKSSIQQLSAYIDSLAEKSTEGKQTKAYTAIPKAVDKEYYTLSSAQKRLFFLYQFDEQSLAYNSTHFARLEGQLDKERLGKAFNKLIARHEGLRTSFEIIDAKHVQKISEQIDFEIEHFKANEQEVRSIVKSFIRPFDLSQCPLIRVALIETASDQHVLVADLHHIITDGVSYSILMKDFMALYNQEELPALNLQYKDYAEWQQSPLHQEALTEQKEFWLKEFEEEVAILQLPKDYPRPLNKGYDGSFVIGELGMGDTNGLKAIAEKEKTTMYMVLLSVYNILLAKLSNSENIVVGTDLFGRPHTDLENIIGMFVNTMGIRTSPRAELSFREYLNEVKTKALQCFDNQDYQYEELVNELDIERNTSHNALFDVMFEYQNFKQSGFELTDLALKPYDHAYEASKFDLTLITQEVDGRIIFKFEYSTELFKKETIERFSTYFQNITSKIIGGIETKISEIGLVTEDEKRQIFQHFNHTAVPLPETETLVSLFEKQVRQTPEATVAVFGDQVLTYSALNKRANQLSNCLNDLLEEKANVPTLMDPSIDLLVSMLGIFKAGMVYVPINPDAPLVRIIGNIADLDAKLLITKTENLPETNEFYQKLTAETEVAHILFQDDVQRAAEAFETGNVISKSSLLSYPDKNPVLQASPDDLCYIIYTSGTTGKPKGAMIHHRGMLNHLYAKIHDLSLDKADVIAQTAPPSFDISIWQFLASLLTGGHCHIIHKEKLLEPALLVEELERGGVTIFESVPSLITTFLAGLPDDQTNILTALRWMIPTGEALSVDLVRKWYSYFPNIKLLNAYGPTEASDDVTHYTVEPPTEGQVTIPIGKPVQNTHILVLDKNLNLCPVGVHGEICVAGPGVGRGYWRDSEKTRKAFVPNPYVNETTEAHYETLYKTGDIGHYLPDGNIVCLGRVDEQVKIRGNRIELGEIENALLKIDRIEKGAIVARSNGNDKFLVAYYLSEEELDIADLRDQLLKQLPDYMVPSYFVQLTELPLTANGKLNKKALPEPELVVSKSHVLPSNKIEEQLLDIWSEVLQIEKEAISVDTSFFELGGHSLRAMVLVNKILKNLEVQIPLKEIFERRDIRNIGQYVASAKKSTFETIKKASVQDFYPTSSAQKRLYFLYALDPASLAYNSTQIVRLEGQLDKEKIEKVFNKLIVRHESLRTSFKVIDDEPVQKISKRVAFKVQHFDASEAEVPAVIEQFVKPFDLNQAPLIRVGLVKVSSSGHVLMVDMHHIITDGVSQGVLIKEFGTLYKGEELTPTTSSYKDYSQWQQSEAQQLKIEKQKQYWLNQFSGELDVLELPTDHARPVVKTNKGDLLSFVLERGEAAELKKMAQAHDTTLFMVLLAIYNVFLSKLSNQDDIVVGTPTTGRPGADFDNVIGMFINILPLRNQIQKDAGFTEFLSTLKSDVLDCFDNQEFQYEELVDELNVQRNSNRNPLFDTMFEFQHLEDDELEIPGLQFRPFENEHNISNFDMALIATDEDDQISFNIEYSTELFKKSTIERFVAYFKNIVKAVISDSNIKLSTIEIITRPELDQMLNEFNGSVVELDRDKTFAQIFKEQVEQTPLRTAVTSDGTALNYRELYDQVIQLSSCLVARGVGPNKKVALYMPRGIEMLTSILAVFHAGGAYVPIDVEYPEKRIKAILNDSESAFLLVSRDSAEEVEELAHSWPHVKTILNVNELDKEQYEVIEEPAAQSVDDLAYIIYTSGTTGKPKGVMIHQLGMINHLQAKIRDLALGQDEIIAQTASPCFDISVWQFLAALMVGGKTCVIETEKLLNPELLIRTLQAEKVTVFESVPSLITAFLDGLPEDKNHSLAHLRWMIPTGEALTVPLVRKWYQYFPDIKLLNAYGPTEASDDVTHHVVEKPHDKQVTVPIGRPVQNTHIYIMDKNLNLCPVGIRGEICVAGPGVGKGYWKNEEKTSKAFVANPLATLINDTDYHRLYKTGDIGYYMENGDVVCLGRVDEQVKIRGFRIELGEIENVLLEIPAINEAALIVKEEGGQKHLVAYYTTDTEVETAGLRDYLFERLPDYMVPSFFEHLNEMPLTANGKLDRRALPDLQIKAEGNYVAPANEVEEKLAEIWEEVLKVDKEVISTNTSFFELGGHSLRSIALVNKAFKEFQVEIPIKLVFELKDIRSLALHIQQAEKSEYLAIEKSKEEKDFYVLSSAQKAIYFLYAFDDQSMAYNMLKVMKIEGQVDLKQFNNIFRQIIARHEVFRTSFGLFDDEPVQIVSGDVDFEVGYHMVDKKDAETTVRSLIRPFDLEQAPLMRADLVQFGPEEYYFVFDTHHIIIDGTSNELLATEFVKLFNGEALPELRLQYKDYAEWQQSDERLLKLEKQKEFWLNEFSGELTRLELPKDFEEPVPKDQRFGSLKFTFDEAETAALRSIIEREGASMFMAILSIYNIFLSKLSNQEDIILGTPVAGREHVDTDHMLGMFVAALPLRNRPRGDMSFKEFLQEVITNTLASFENQAYQYEAPVHELNIERSASQNALYDAFFIFQNFEKATELELSGLKFTGLGVGEDGELRYAINLVAEEHGNEVHLFLDLNEYFKKETGERFLKYFKNILKTVISNPDVRLSDIEIITEPELDQLLNKFNGPVMELDKEKTFAQLFVEQVKQTPLRTAVTCGKTALNYQELYEKVIQLSSCLVAKGVKPNTNVALYMPRSIEMLTSILAVFHAGGAYVPIDVEYPEKRIKSILNDSESAIVLISQDSAEEVKELVHAMPHVKTLLNVNELDKEDYEVIEEPTSQSVHDLAYIIYTSGTTGRPKGVMIHQLGMINHLQAKINDLELGQDEIIAQTASPCFDISVWQFLAALMVGGKTCVIETEKLLDPELLIRTLQAEKVTIFESVPSLITAFLDGLPEDTDHSLVHLRWMIPTGEALTVPLVRKWYSYFPDIKLLNAYGPTEASDDVTHHVVEKPHEKQVTVPIGRPVQNTHIYIMDKYLNPCPIGVKGEICVAGPGVGKGYWKNEEKTSKAFVANPLADIINDADYHRLYKTGDIGYFMENGEVICLGRVDEQVKIRGFRIELGEIENVLLEISAINEAAVIVKEEDGQKHLVAYYTTDIEVETASLRDHLFEKLPDYMVPAYFVYLDEMPLTSNGKLDRAALPKPEFGAAAQYVAPSGDVEEKLVDIWSEVLGMDPTLISATESFFFIGGHSLNSIKLTSKIHKEFNVKVSLQEFFSKPTVRLLARHIEARLWLTEKPADKDVKKKDLII
ncbi:MAG: hypothetical protein Roseis2KO_30660 [Roseivirga sp.]